MKNEQFMKEPPTGGALTGVEKRTGNYLKYTSILLSLLALLLFAISGCNKKDALATAGSSSSSASSNNPSGQLKSLTVTPGPSGNLTAVLPPHMLGDFEQVNLVANKAGTGGRVDPSLLNPWGMAFNTDGEIWISANHSGAAVFYDPKGGHVNLNIDIPLHGVSFGSSPDGIVANHSMGFVIPSTHETSKFIFSSEDGILAAWSSGNVAQTVADRSMSGAVYKGLAMAERGGVSYLYATNFSMAKIDVFDEAFRYVDMSFSDPAIPAGFAPFNIKAIDGKLYVTYAKQKPDHHDDMAGPGNGYIDIFNTDGMLLSRFASNGTLNSPWGITETEARGRPEFIYVANFGDGRINVFDMRGDFKGQLGDEKAPITINGLWAIDFDHIPGAQGSDVNGRLYFTAGPNEENDGLFGYIRQSPLRVIGQVATANVGAAEVPLRR